MDPTSDMHIADEIAGFGVASNGEELLAGIAVNIPSTGDNFATANDRTHNSWYQGKGGTVVMPLSSAAKWHIVNCKSPHCSAVNLPCAKLASITPFDL